MAMNKQRKNSNLINILSYDDAGNIVLKDYSQTIRYNWNGTIHAFTGPLSISSVAAAVTDTDRFLVSDGGVLKYRTGAEVLSDIGAIGGSGATGQVAYWNGTSSQTGSNNLFWNSANNRLGINTSTPTSALQVVGTVNATNVQTPLVFSTGADPLTFATQGGTAAMVIFPTTRNVIIQNSGSFSDGGQRLQVQGDAFIKGSGATSATTALSVQNSAGTNLLRVQNNGIVSIGDGPADTISNNGDVILKLNSSFQYWTIQNRQNAGLEFLNQNYAGGYSFFTLTDARNTSSSQTNALFQRFFTQNSVNNRTFINVELRGDINQTGGATGISRGLYLNHTLISAADWRSIEWSNNSGWGLYGAGTAANYLGGRLYVNNNTSGFSPTNASIGTEGGIYAAQLSQFGASIYLTGAFSNNGAFSVGLLINGSSANTTITSVKSVNLSIPNLTATSVSGVEVAALQITGAFSKGSGTTVTYAKVLDLSSVTGGVNNTILTLSNTTTNNQQTGNWAIYNASTYDSYFAGKLVIGTTTVSTFALDVNGTARVSGVSTFGGTLNINTAAWLQFNGANVLLGEGTNTFLQANGGGSIIFRNNTPSELMRLTSGGNLLVGTTVDQGYRVQITSASADSQLNVWGATAPSIRLDNAASGATQRFVIGLATATNNFIQGANAGDICMTPGTSSALVFGMWQTSSSSEVMRISTSSNVLIGKNTDSGQKLQVVGKVNLTSLPTSATGLMAGDVWNNGGVLNIV